MKLDASDIDRLLDDIADRLRDWLRSTGNNDPVIIGIQTGGYWIAEKLQQRMGRSTPLGHLNIAFYRDDFSRIGMHPRVTPSNLPFKVEGRDVVLVDDVLHTGRTIRAAMNEIFDFGRPASITLVVLIERSGHELPIKADIAGKSLALKPDEHAKLLGPDPLALEIKKVE